MAEISRPVVVKLLNGLLVSFSNPEFAMTACVVAETAADENCPKTVTVDGGSVRVTVRLSPSTVDVIVNAGATAVTV